MKKKIFGITLAVCILVLSIASTTIAYFTDTDKQTQVFTAGNVAIKLSDNILIGDGDNPSNVFPGQKIGNAAKITNIGTEQAYVGAIISLGDGNPAINRQIAEELFADLAVSSIVKYEANKFYLIFDTPVAKDASVTIFSSIDVPNSWDNNTEINTNMSIFKDGDTGLNITVTAYATQTFGFGSAAEALNAAFRTVWPAPSPSN